MTVAPGAICGSTRLTTSWTYDGERGGVQQTVWSLAGGAADTINRAFDGYGRYRNIGAPNGKATSLTYSAATGGLDTVLYPPLGSHRTSARTSEARSIVSTPSNRAIAECLLATAESAMMGFFYFLIVAVGLLVTARSARALTHPPSLPSVFGVFVGGFGLAGLFVGLFAPPGARKWPRRGIALIALAPVMVSIPIVLNRSLELAPGAIAAFALLECIMLSFPYGDVIVAAATARAARRKHDSKG